MLQPSTVFRVLAVLSVPSCVWLLASTIGCSADRPHDPVEIAQIAVRANPSLELLATDERQGVLTVRVKRTGQILTVHAADVTAGTAFRDLESSTGAPSATAAPSASSVSGSSTSKSGSPGPRSDGGASRTEVTSAGRHEVVQETPGGARVVQEAPGGVRVVTDSATGRVSITTPTARVVAGGTQVTAGTGQSLPAEAREARSAKSGTSDKSQTSEKGEEAGAHIDESRLERRTRSVVCVGSQAVQLDGVLLRVDDAAIQVTGPCKISIRNSHIVGEIALQMTGSGVITIDNSIIEGRSAAFQLAGDAVVEVRASTVRGAVQSVQNAKVRDQGSNLWK